MKSLLMYFLLAQAVMVAAAQTVSPPAQPSVLGTTFVNWDSLTARGTPVGEQRAVFDNPTPTLEKLEVHVTTLLPGMESHPVHHHAWEEILLVKEGNVVVSINGRKQHAGPGAMIFFASNDPHNLVNAGDKPATYYVINFYTDLVHTVSDKPAAEQAVPGKLASSVIDCNSLPATPTKTGSRVSVVSSPTLTFLALESHITTLSVGQSTASDIVDAGDEFVVFKSGMVEVTVNGVADRMKEGSMLYWAPNDKRTLRNIGTTPVSYQVIRVTSGKTPKLAGE
jgi:XRE family transcriptional regulator, regulator of sulfur utilization